MEIMEEEYNKEKYFLDQSRNKIYARKGEGHKALAYRLIHKLGFDNIYFYYEDTMPATKFLICCGYVLVDENEQGYKASYDNCERIKFTTVAYCSKTIDENYVKYLLDIYDNGENVIEDMYEVEGNQKHKIDEIIRRIEAIKELRQQSSQQGDERE